MSVMDSDFLYAKKLQEEFNREGLTERNTKAIKKDSKNENSVVDPNWEIYDPNPDIYNLFQLFNAKFFWNQLGSVEVKWSPRMYSCAGVCTYKGRQGCTVSLSLPLLKLRPRKDLVETLLHEMIHAYLFVTDKNSEREEHGPKFHSHMHRINKAAGTNITVYHTFHDEVKHYKTHWWRCNGSCRFKHPYYGLVKRAMNRPPGPNDFWFGEHKLTCGGEFVKVKEPDGFKSRKSKKAKTDKENLGKQQSLNKYFSPPHISKPKIASSVDSMNSSNKNENIKSSVQNLGKSSNIHGFKGVTPKVSTPSGSNFAKNGDQPGSGSGIGNTSNRGGSLLEKSRTVASTSYPKSNNIHGFNGLTPTVSKPSGSNFTNNGNRPGSAYGIGITSNRGGTLVEKPRTVASTSSEPKTTQIKTTQSNFTPYTGNGQVLDPSCKQTDINRANSRLLNLYPVKKKDNSTIQDQNPSKKPKIDECEATVSLLDENVEDNRHLVNCPVCNKELPQELVNEHLDECMNLATIMETLSETVVIEDDPEEIIEENTNQNVNCPNCDEKCTLNSINQHLDDCLQTV